MEGIIKTTLVNVYRFPSESAEMVTQVLFATVVIILDEKKGWSKVKIPVQQNYCGWIKKEYISRGKPPAGYYKRIIVWKHLTALKDEPQENSKTVLKLPLNTRLLVLEKRGDWLAVWTPDGGKAWLNEQEQREARGAGSEFCSFCSCSNSNHGDPGLDSYLLSDGSITQGRTGDPGDKNTGDRILSLARTFLGAPYLWGGITPEGFDCSGFVYTLYAMHGYALHRDADLQYEKDGQFVGRNEMYPGDLLYFYGVTADRPTHVGIYEGDQNFINASGRGGGVVSYSLMENNWRLKLSGAKRVLISKSKDSI